MEEAGGDGRRIHFHFRQHAGYFQRVHQVGIARGAGLSSVIFLGEFVSFLDNAQIIIGPVDPQRLHQVTETGYCEDVGRDLLAQSRHIRL